MADAARSEIQAALLGRFERDVEDDILIMEAKVPGLGGAYIQDGDIVVFVPDTTNRAAILDGLARASTSLSLNLQTRSQLATGTRIRLRIGSFGFSELVSWEKALAPRLRQVRSVSFLDADEAKNRITIGIADQRHLSAVLAAAASLGIPVAALNVETRQLETSMATLRSEVDTVAGGMQIENVNGQVCTIGWNVHRGEDAPDGEEGFFTAGHCASSAQEGSGVTNSPIYQATTSRRIALITQNPVWNAPDSECTYTRCTHADALYARYDDPTISRKAQMAQPNGTVGTNNNTGPMSADAFWTDLDGTTSTFLVGSTVEKVGRTTGWTRGTVSATCATVDVGGHPDPYTVLCAHQVTGAAAGEGDSGAPVFQIDLSGVVRRGILFSSLLRGELNDPNRNWAFNSEGLKYCTSSCSYSYSSWNQINLWLPQPPF